MLLELCCWEFCKEEWYSSTSFSYLPTCLHVVCRDNRSQENVVEVRGVWCMVIRPLLSPCNIATTCTHWMRLSQWFRWLASGTNILQR